MGRKGGDRRLTYPEGSLIPLRRVLPRRAGQCVPFQSPVRCVLVLLLQRNGLCLRSVNAPHPTAKRRPDAERAVYIAALIASRTYPSAMRLYANTITDPNLPSFLFRQWNYRLGTPKTGIPSIYQSRLLNRRASAQSSAGHVFSMMRAPLRRVNLALGQRFAAAVPRSQDGALPMHKAEKLTGMRH
jgi:hypothetical protein